MISMIDGEEMIVDETTIEIQKIVEIGMIEAIATGIAITVSINATQLSGIQLSSPGHILLVF